MYRSKVTNYIEINLLLDDSLIYVNSPTQIRYDAPLPVVVLVSTETLAGGRSWRPARGMSRQRDVVFVQPRFRLGALGFLAASALSRSAYPPRSGNYGLSDLIAALDWVQLNIEHFGGDPDVSLPFVCSTRAVLTERSVTVCDNCGTSRWSNTRHCAHSLVEASWCKISPAFQASKYGSLILNIFYMSFSCVKFKIFVSMLNCSGGPYILYMTVETPYELICCKL